MTMNFKRILSLITAFCCLAAVFVFSGCDAFKKESAMAINNVEISNDVFTYFLDCATVELGAEAPYDSLASKTEALASVYFKTNSLAHKEKLSLSTAEKAAVSEKVSAYWSLYGEYYNSIGVTRETLTKVYTAEAFRKALLVHYYGTGGAEEIPLSRLYAQFRTNYIVFQSITGYFTRTDINGNSVSIPEADKEALILKFQNMSAMVNAGEQDMEQAADFLGESGYKSSVQTVILNREDTSYPSGFFEKVQSLESRRAAVIGTTEYIFLVLRGDADSSSDYFNEKKPEMIEIIVGDEIDTKINSSMKTDVEIRNSVARGYLSLITKAKRQTEVDNI